MCDDAGLANLADGRSASGTRSPTRWRDVVNRTRKGHRPSDRHRNCFRGQAWETSQRRGGAHSFWAISGV